MPIQSATGQGFAFGRKSSVVCLGDSITEARDGYVAVMFNLLAAAYPERAIRLHNAGMSGNRAPDMLSRLSKDVIALSPDWVTINVGINDVWHGFADSEREYPNGDGPRGVPVDLYEATVAEMTDALRETTDADIVLITPTVIGEDLDNLANIRLKAYSEAMTRVAECRGTYLVPLRDDIHRALRAGRGADGEYRLTTDGVHLNAIGNHVMALSILYALGFSG